MLPELPVASMIDRLLIIGDPRKLADIRLQALRLSRHSESLPDLAGLPASSGADLVLVFQHWPDEFTDADVHRLIAACPLARIIVCQGPWCASYGRTRNLWPAAVCVFAEEAIDRLHRECEVLAGQRAPLPLTAGLDEIFAFNHDPASCVSLITEN